MGISQGIRRAYRRIEGQRAGVAVAVAAFGLLTLTLAPLLDEKHLLEVALVYLLTTLAISALWGYRVGLAAAVVADLLVNFFFVPPLHTFTVARVENVVALVIFLAVAAIGASLLESLRRQVVVAEAREAETRMLLDVSRDMANGISPRDSLDRFCRAVVSALRVRGCAVVRDGFPLTVEGSSGGVVSLTRDEESVARAAMTAGEVATLGSARRVGDAIITYVPFAAGQTRGVVRINGAIHLPPLADGDRLLAAFAREAMGALERSVLAAEAARVTDLRRADELKTVLLSSVSHDLRSPLTAIKAAVGNLRDESIAWSEDDRKAFLEAIESQADRLTATVTGLLEMSRLEGGVVHPDLEVIDAGMLLADVAAQAAAIAPGRLVKARSSASTWLVADYALLYQALTNLVENAGRYSIPGGGITLDATLAPPNVRLAVRDEGPGIPPGDLPLIFEKFYRGASVGGTKGSGLGLAIVKAMVELCKGRISVDSGPTGTEFTILLPATREAVGS